ncbi:MAG TPA: zinc-ribbon domain-containing protein [Candidatus Acidoferrales bacterium]|nr:zinc-ribbon domain-containing protein [Candidatus Acidoferrales bacterium]
MISCPKCYAQIADGSNFCSECGHEIRRDASRRFDIYCSQCGQRITGRRDAQREADAEFNRAGVQASVPENVACVLTYLFWWITGLVFLITDKRKMVRFHAAQSVVVFGSLTAMEFATLRFARNAFMDQMWYSSLWFLGASIVGFVWVAMWVILMLHAYEKKPFRVPIAARIADRFARA